MPGVMEDVYGWDGKWKPPVSNLFTLQDFTRDAVLAEVH